MNLKNFANAIALFIGLGLAAYSFSGKGQRFDVKSQSVLKDTAEHIAVEEEQKHKQVFEIYQLKPGSIYDGDTLRVVRANEELKIRFCGIDAPERDQKLGIESRDHLRSLANINNGELWLIPIEKDRHGRTVAEVYVRDSYNSAVNLNVQMVRDGYAWHYEEYSNTCPIREEFAVAQELAREEGLGIWSGNPQPPWEFRKANK